MGVRVLDLTRLLPGPFSTQLLCDLGAEVIKIERPGEGDGARSLFINIGGYGASFLMLNRGKKSLTLDLKNKFGAEVFRRLAGSADVIVESFRPGVMDRLGLSYNHLRRDNRKLIYCSLTGYGQEGPYAQRAGHDLNYLCYAGLAATTGPRGGAPVPPGIQAGDVAAGAMMAALGVMAALFNREHTGRGQYIDVAMMDGLMAVGQTLFGEYFATGNVPGPATMRLSGGYPVYAIYETKDGGQFALCALEKKFWDVFCDKVGREDLKEMHGPGWDEKRDELETELKKIFKNKTRDQWTELLVDEDTCGTPVLGMDEVIDDPQVKHRKMIFECPHPEEGTVRQVAFPVKFSDIEPADPKPAPRLGQHTDEILMAIGYSRKEIRELHKEGVV
jgi:crotonobetainyl-CoA:carnitine CoA-transferase CaiB-like acyl-CoA transferase